LPPNDGCHRMVNSSGDKCSACHGAGTSRTNPPAGSHPTGSVVLVSGSSGNLSFNAGNRTCSTSCHKQHGGSWGNCSGD
jgi:hypothetical protein